MPPSFRRNWGRCLEWRRRWATLSRPHEPPDSVLLSDRIWRERLGADRGVVGKTMRLNERAYTVAGVMPREAPFPDWADVWLPPGPLLAD